MSRKAKGKMLKAELKSKCPGRRPEASAFSLQPSAFARSAFTLVELLVVLAIMGIIAAMVVPAIKNFGASDAMTAADQQVLGDVARARQLAMSQRSTVYMVFVPTNFWAYLGALTPTELAVATNLCGDQLSGYIFMSYGNVGDQPGQHQWHYLSPWQPLPDGTFIPLWKFSQTTAPFRVNDSGGGKTFSIYPFDYSAAFPFPTETTPTNMVSLPFIAFNYLGQLTTNGVDMAAVHALIPLAKGGVQAAMDPNSKIYQFASPQIAEVPSGNSTNAYNIVDIDPLTGRASLQTPKVR